MNYKKYILFETLEDVVEESNHIKNTSPPQVIIQVQNIIRLWKWIVVVNHASLLDEYQLENQNVTARSFFMFSRHVDKIGKVSGKYLVGLGEQLGIIYSSSHQFYCKIEYRPVGGRHSNPIIFAKKKHEIWTQRHHWHKLINVYAVDHVMCIRTIDLCTVVFRINYAKYGHMYKILIATSHIAINFSKYFFLWNIS